MRRAGDLGRLAGNPQLVIGIIGAIALLAIGVFGPQLTPQDPNAQHWILEGRDARGDPMTIFPPSAPDQNYLLGTDHLGRDQLSRLLAGARITLTVVLAAALARLALGLIVGLAAGWYGRAVDRAARVVTTAFAAVPQLLLAVLFVLILRRYSLAGFVVALAIVGWPPIAEFVRTEVQRAKTAPFMEAARSLGARDRWLVRRHLLSSLAPELITLTALETGGVLLLLAELGLIGLFIAGATYYLNEEGGPVLPLRDRAPEWGQMLGGIQFYAAQEQIVVLIPAVVILLAAVTLTLLADGLRSASDPFSTRRLHPNTFGWLAKTLGAAVLVSSVGFVGFNVRTNAITLEEGRVLAQETASRSWPGSEYVAAVVRYSSSVHAMERPQRMTYYFRNEVGEVLRISFISGDRLAMEVREYESEDEIDFHAVEPLSGDITDYGPVLNKVDAQAGAAWRRNAPNYLVRVVLTWPTGDDQPSYRITYGTQERLQQALVNFCCYDARTGNRLTGVVRTAPLPFPIPATCPATALEPELLRFSDQRPPLTRFLSEHSASPAKPVLVLFSNVVYEGDNAASIENALIPPAVLSAENGSGRDGTAEFVVRDTTTDAYHGVLRFGAPGCWAIRFAGRDGSLDLVLYAFPYDCRPPNARAAPRAPSPCRP